MQGDVKELLTRTESASLSDPDGAAVYAEVERLARLFDMKSVRRVLQQARSEHS